MPCLALTRLFLAPIHVYVFKSFSIIYTHFSVDNLGSTFTSYFFTSVYMHESEGSLMKLYQYNDYFSGNNPFQACNMIMSCRSNINIVPGPQTPTRRITLYFVIMRSCQCSMILAPHKNIQQDYHRSCNHAMHIMYYNNHKYCTSHRSHKELHTFESQIMLD